MRMLLGFVASGALLAPSLPLPAAAAETGSSNKAKDPNKVICENQTVIGSRLAVKRKCLTRAQWEEHRLATKDAVDSLQRGGSTCTLEKKC